MKSRIKVIPCQKHYIASNRISPSLVVEYTLNYYSDAEDRILIDKLFEDAELQARHVNPHAANSTTDKRNNDILIANNLAGILFPSKWTLFRYMSSGLRI